MQIPVGNPCVRCGKERVVVKEWTEKIGQTSMIRTLTKCPDKECQKILDDEAAAQKEKRDAITQKKAQDKEERAKLLAAAKA